MSSGAQLESVDSLRQFRVRLCELSAHVHSALAEAESEISSTAHWLAHAQTLHWKNQLRIRTEEFSRARGALSRKKAEKSPTGGRQSCVEEEQAFKHAERRLEDARQKSIAVKQWMRKLDQAALNYRPSAQMLSSTVEVDVSRGLARLDDMVAALEAYLAGGPAPEWATSESVGSSMRRAEPAAAEVSQPTERPLEGKGDTAVEAERAT